MIAWISATPWRMPLIFVVYYSLHIAARTLVSPSLDYDESEQVFLSQCLLYGYNSQPPLYTWVQTGVFEILGYSVFALAALKNILLCGTFLLVFASVRKATDNVSLGTIAALGLLTVPQISWESHRDLSHTVAVTFATMLILFSVIGLAKDGRSRWYVLIGVAAALGMLSKYNFAIVIVGMIVAGLTVPTYRQHLQSWRMVIAVSIAAVLVLPHAIWMGAHLELISSKTISTLTTNQSNDWFQDVSAGFAALAISAFSCCAITLATFLPCVHRGNRDKSIQRQNSPFDLGAATTLLLERFLIVITIVLCLLVLSGHALEFKNRWIQPFVVVLPAYFVLRLRNFFPAKPRIMNRVCAIGFVVMFVILTSVVMRPLVGGYRSKYCWLNVPYNELALTINNQTGDAPAIIVASDMIIAGNLRLHFPGSRVLAKDQQYLTDRIIGDSRHDLQTQQIVVVTDNTDFRMQKKLMEYAHTVLRTPSGSHDDWHSVDVKYLYGRRDDGQQFFVRELAVERVAMHPALTTDKTR